MHTSGRLTRVVRNISQEKNSEEICIAILCLKDYKFVETTFYYFQHPLALVQWA